MGTNELALRPIRGVPSPVRWNLPLQASPGVLHAAIIGAWGMLYDQIVGSDGRLFLLNSLRMTGYNLLSKKEGRKFLSSELTCGVGPLANVVYLPEYAGRTVRAHNSSGGTEGIFLYDAETGEFLGAITGGEFTQGYTEVRDHKVVVFTSVTGPMLHVQLPGYEFPTCAIDCVYYKVDQIIAMTLLDEIDGGLRDYMKIKGLKGVVLLQIFDPQRTLFKQVVVYYMEDPTFGNMHLRCHCQFLREEFCIGGHPILPAEEGARLLN